MKSTRWNYTRDLSFQLKEKKDLSRLAEEMLRERSQKGHVLDLAGTMRESPHWRAIHVQKKKFTSAVNVLLTMGGTVGEYEYIIREIFKLHKSFYKKDELLYSSWGNFVDNTFGNTITDVLKNHIRFMADLRSDKPSNGYCFHGSSPENKIAAETYVVAIGTWGKGHKDWFISDINANNESRSSKSNLIGYIPDINDIKRAFKAISRKNRSVSIDDLLNWLEEDFQRRGIVLDPEWRLKTEKNCELWFNEILEDNNKDQ